jgi:hypothetical protein
MIQQDSILSISDTLKTLSTSLPVKHHVVQNVDTAVVADTIKAVVQKPTNGFEIPYLYLQKPDTSTFDIVHMYESFKPVVTKFTSGFEGILHPLLPQSANWVFCVLAALLLLLIISFSNASSLMLQDVKSYFHSSERPDLYRKTTLNDFRAQFLLIIFAMGVISFFAHLHLYESSSNFELLDYGYLLGITVLFFCLKYIVIQLLGFVFLEPKILSLAKFSYFNIISLLGVSLFPLLLLRIYAPTNLHHLIDIMSAVVCVLAYILITIKSFQLFLHKIVASFYILLYLCTLEFLPLFLLLKAYQLIV